MTRTAASLLLPIVLAVVGDAVLGDAVLGEAVVSEERLSRRVVAPRLTRSPALFLSWTLHPCSA